MQLGRRTAALLVQTIRGNDALVADNDGSPANLQGVQGIFDKSIGSPNTGCVSVDKLDGISNL